MSSSANPYLLISRVGAHSLHETWLGPVADRGFDVLLSAFDDNVVDPGQPDVFFERRAGSKVAGYGAVFEAHAELISRYAYVAVFDDDLSISAAALLQLFEIADAHDLKIAQPSLTHDSYFTYAGLLHNPAYRLRYVNYIEMMCPVFRADVFREIQPLYDMGYESGIDLIWCNLVATSPQDFAVIDDVCVRHTRPVGTLKAANGFTGTKRYEDDIHALLDRFNLPWLSCVPYAGIHRDGLVTRDRLELFVSSLRLAGAIGRCPDYRHRARSVAVHWKHLLTRKALNVPISLASKVA